MTSTQPAVDLYWIPLGAGSPVVQASGRLVEGVSALLQRRPRCALYHAALEVRTPAGRFTIEQTPVPSHDEPARGVVAVGPVGTRGAGRWRVFRYEIRCWRDGVIPDLDHAVGSPVRLTTDVDATERIIERLPAIPAFVWGRRAPGTDEMWNSNSVISWILEQSEVDVDGVAPPPGGRAPGWGAGRAIAVAARRRSSPTRPP